VFCWLWGRRVETPTRRLNAHLSSIVSVSTRRSSFRMPVEALARTGRRDDGRLGRCASRLSSFGFSGTIAHGAFASPTTESGKCEDERPRWRMESCFRRALADRQQSAARLQVSGAKNARTPSSVGPRILTLEQQRCSGFAVEGLCARRESPFTCAAAGVTRGRSSKMARPALGARAAPAGGSLNTTLDILDLFKEPGATWPPRRQPRLTKICWSSQGCPA